MRNPLQEDVAGEARPVFEQGASELEPTKKRLHELDALRGLAALAVVFFHLLPQHVYWGWIGVDVFFVLSGFLITRIILESNRDYKFLRHFYVRRIIRIWPAYYLAILVAAVLALLSRTRQPMAGLPYALFFVQNIPAYWGGLTPPFTLRMAHTWTVAIEEQFYLVWPLLIMRFERKLLWIVLLLVLAAVSMRIAQPRVDLLLSRCDGLALGAGIAWYWRDGRAFDRRAWALWAGLLALVMAYAVGGTRAYGKEFLDVVPLWRAPTILVVSVFAALLVTGVLNLSGSRSLSFLRIRPLVSIGEMSYGLYLFHMLVFWVADGLLERFSWQRSIMFNVGSVLSCLIVALGSWQLIERPILRLRSRFPL